MRTKIKTLIRKYVPFLENVYLVILGNREIWKLRNKFGNDTHIIFMMGATGDTYLQLRMLGSYLKEKKIDKYVLTGYANGIAGLLPLFPQYYFYPMRDYCAKAVQKACMILGQEYLNITIMFPWTYDLYVNRCRIRMTEKFNFMDTYKWYVLNLRDSVTMDNPIFIPLSKKLEEKYLSMGIVKEKSIILATEANSVTSLDDDVWVEIIDELKHRGYEVFINSKGDKYGCKSIFVPYSEYEALLNYVGHFIGIRSGLCDIVSTIPCKKIIIYPQKARVVNYSEHRSEIEFCGLKVMGLVNETDTNVVEIETKLIRNITQATSEIENQEEYLKEINKLRNDILMNM